MPVRRYWCFNKTKTQKKLIKSNKILENCWVDTTKSTDVPNKKITKISV